MPDRRSIWITASMALLIVGLALLVPFLMEMAQVGGRRIPTDDLQADYALGLGWAALLGLSIAFWPVPEAHRGALLRLWGVKTIVTLGVMLFSEWFYDMDAYAYFRDGRDGVFGWSDFEFGAGTQTITLLTGLQTAVLPSYHAAKVTFSMMGLLAVYFTYLATRLYAKSESLQLLYVIGLWPSVLFWSSILGKDPLVLLGISTYALGVAYCHTRRNLSGLPLLLIGVLVASVIRPWLVAIMLLPLSVFGALGLRTVRARIMLIALAFALLPLAAASTAQRLGFKEGDGAVKSIEKQNSAWERGASTRQLGTTDGTLGSVVALAPVGMLSILFRPMPGEVNNVFGAMAGLENVVLLTLFLRSVRRTRLRELRDPFVLWAIAFILVWLAGYATVAASNVGASVRYRLQIMPLFLWLLMYFSRERPADEKSLAANRRPGPLPRLNRALPQRQVARLLVAGPRRLAPDRHGGSS